MDPYVGEIRMFGGNFAPVGWALCNGQTLSISENDVLFNLIGTTYGGDGQQTFNLPNLQSRVPVHMGTSGAGTVYQLGAMAGTETVTLTTQQMPAHSHPVKAAGVAGNINVPAIDTVLSDMGAATSPPVYGAYSAGNTVALNSQTIMPAGGNQPHGNVQPNLAINFIISLYGIYPSPS